MAKEKKDLTLGEKAVNWAKAVGIILPLIGAGIVSVVGYFKSNDAQDGVDNLVHQLSDRVGKQEKVINVQSEKLEKLTRMIMFLQGHQAGVSAGKLFVKVEETEKKLDACWAKKTSIKKSDLEKLLGTVRKSKKLKPKASGGSGDVQQIPRLYPKPFSKEK